MAGGWLDVTDARGTRREALREGLTRFGGPGADVVIANGGADQLHVWDRPPRAVFVGQGARPTLDGAPFEEAGLAPGDAVEWAGATLVYGGEAAEAHTAPLEEMAIGVPTAAAAPAAPLGGLGEHDRKAWRRLCAGLMVDLGQADKAAVKRWQSAVMDNTFQADACADEILARSGGPSANDAFVERSGRLLRDFLMAPLMRGVKGTSRRMRQAARGGFAALLSQLVAVSIYSLILIAMILLWRLKGHSVDGLLDQVLDVFRFGGGQ